MKDIINSFKAHLYERTSSPLLGSFIFYWIICNYKFIVILFDKDLTSENKFIAIDNLYKTDYIPISILNIPINGLLLPLSITLAYVLVLPFISKFIHKAWIWHQNELKKISNGKVLTEKEFGELQQKYFELELSFSKTFSEKDKEITQLKKFLDEKEQIHIADKSAHMAEIINKNNELDKIEKKLDEKLIELDNLSNENKEKKITNNTSSYYPLDNHTELYILEYIGENPDKNTRDIINTFEIKRIETELIYDKLLKSNFIELHETYSNGDKNFRITPQGREFLIAIKGIHEEINEDNIPF